MTGSVGENLLQGPFPSGDKGSKFRVVFLDKKAIYSLLFKIVFCFVNYSGPWMRGLGDHTDGVLTRVYA